MSHDAAPSAGHPQVGPRVSRRVCTGLLVGAGLAGGSASGVPVTRTPSTPVPEPEYRQFQRHMLKLALRKAGWSDALDIVPTQTWMRQVRELRAGHVDVSPLPALQAEVYAQFGLRRVDFPLRGGLLGVRRLLVLRERLPAFAGLKDLQHLKRDFVLGYGSDWGDLAEMRRLGFRLQTAGSLDALYGLLRAHKVDYLSRGLNEVAQELSRFDAAANALDLVPGVVLHYPLDDCFFVSPRRPDLHEALSLGMQRAAADGSHAALLRQHYGSELAQLGGARALRVEGYPAPPGLDPALFEGWRPALKGPPPSRAALVPAKVRPRLLLAAGQNPDDPRARFAEHLLQLALSRGGMEMDVVVHEGLNTGRRAAALQFGRIDVGQLPCYGEVRPGQALPVRFPMRRGLLGLRLLLARRDRAAALAAVGNLSALQSGFQLGHGASWADLPLMRKAGFRVKVLPPGADLYRALQGGEFDFASRGVNEIWDELESWQRGGGDGLTVVPGIALAYPIDDLLWVGPRRSDLQQMLERGLSRALQDGSYLNLFQSSFGPLLKRAGLAQRRVWSLPDIAPPPGLAADGFDVLRLAAGAANKLNGEDAALSASGAAPSGQRPRP